MNVTPLITFSLSEQIADRLRADVLSGRFAKGQRIAEPKLASLFGVSRTPIHEALHQLTQEGLLERRLNGGVQVARQPPDAIRDLLAPTRRSVEEFALRSIFASIVPADYLVWNAILESMRRACQARDFVAIAEQDIALHRSIVGRAGQHDLDLIWASLVARMRSYFLETQQDYSNPMDIYREHVELVETFSRGNLEDAVHALEQNIA